jgi:hypothetical protein
VTSFPFPRVRKTFWARPVCRLIVGLRKVIPFTREADAALCSGVECWSVALYVLPLSRRQLGNKSGRGNTLKRLVR